MLSPGGDYTTTMIRGAAASSRSPCPAAAWQPPEAPDATSILANERVKSLAKVVPPRPAGFCTGCPERPIFAATGQILDLSY
jgi:indolepyruvate ferredoxin oxidoreductase alpha subunit